MQVGRDALMACGGWLVHGGHRVCGVPKFSVTRAVNWQERSPHALSSSQWNHISGAVIGQSACARVIVVSISDPRCLTRAMQYRDYYP